jgi:hypothetical protein
MPYFKPRGLLDCRAAEADDPTEDPRFGRSGSRLSRTPGR